MGLRISPLWKEMRQLKMCQWVKLAALCSHRGHLILSVQEDTEKCSRGHETCEWHCEFSRSPQTARGSR